METGSRITPEQIRKAVEVFNGETLFGLCFKQGFGPEKERVPPQDAFSQMGLPLLSHLADVLTRVVFHGAEAPTPLECAAWPSGALETLTQEAQEKARLASQRGRERRPPR